MHTEEVPLLQGKEHGAGQACQEKRTSLEGPRKGVGEDGQMSQVFRSSLALSEEKE